MNKFMTKTITNKVVALATLLAMTLPMALFAYDAGNDAVSRANVDTYSNFTIVDTNNPFATDGLVEMFEYYAANTNKFRVLIVDETSEVKWVSPEITPGLVGENTYSPNPMPAVEAGWDLAIYSVATGVIPFGYNAAAEPAAYEGNGAGLPALGETLTFAGYTDRYYSLNATLFYVPMGQIVAPEDDSIMYGDLNLLATYDDGDGDNDDVLNWAVRLGTCTANTGTVAGNVDGYSDSFEWNGADFSAMLDTSTWVAGHYCFVFNPTDDGPVDVRETRWFYVADKYVSGGGQIIQEIGPKVKDWHKISFGGWVANIGSLVGSLQVNFHNVTDPDVADGSKFHGTEVTALNLYDGPVGSTCVEAMNTTVHGTFNGESGYKLVLRAGDSGLPASTAYPNDDTVRIELWKGATMLYDTNGGDFTQESSCVGTVRTGLDAGNISIYSQ